MSTGKGLFLSFMALATAWLEIAAHHDQSKVLLGVMLLTLIFAD